MLNILREATIGSFSSIKQIATIVFPLMIAMEILKDIGILDKIARLFSPLVKVYGMKRETGFPLLIGIVFGLTYGAGVILQSAKEDKLTRRDLYLLTYFLVAAHAVFEDTAIFMAFGVNGILLLITRLLVASLFTFIASRLIKPDAALINSSSEVVSNEA
ncbi:MAG: nucleoside recognition domain-containing protein [Tepidanaerobacteraceae bacterium]|nr:nucleoside recognition domain-containing protein [Tepidanaerobacteraceae bacterium]